MSTEYKKQWRIKNRQKIRDYETKWRNENPDLVKKHKQKFNEKNPHKQKEYSLKFRQNNPEKDKAWHKTRKHKIGSECSKCGSKETLQKHHPDYNKPLVFVTVCLKCHWLIHRKEKNGR